MVGPDVEDPERVDEPDDCEHNGGTDREHHPEADDSEWTSRLSCRELPRLHASFLLGGDDDSGSTTSSSESPC